MYKSTENGVIRNSDGAFIPNSATNSDWRIYLDWAKTNQTPIYEVTAPAVIEVQMRQARLALLQAGYYDVVNAAINAMPGAAGKSAQIEWQVSNTLKRNHPLVISMGAVLQLNAAQLDGLFALAATL